MSNNTDPQDPSRRRLLKLGAWVGSTLLASAASRYTDKGLNVVEELLGESQDRTPDLGQAFLRLSLGKLPAISTGNGNLVAAINDTQPKISSYIRRAGVGVSGALCAAFPNYQPKVCSSPELSPFDGVGDGLFLGGPFSNPDTARFLGYDLSLRDRLVPQLPCPKASADFRLPFEFLNGESTRGEFGGTVYTAKRFDNGERVERPVFRIKDRKHGNTWRCETEDGWLASEFLQIVRVITRDGHVKLFAWGLHGHSLDGFLRPGQTITRNLQELTDRTKKFAQFHALIPTKLERARALDGAYMRATPQWDLVDRYGLVRDLSGVFS